MAFSDTVIVEFHDPSGPGRRWRFYIGDIDALLWHLRRLRYGAPAAGIIPVCNVHMFITARNDEALASALSSVPFAICDGQPIAWLAGLVVSKPVRRITGPEILRRTLLEGETSSRIALVGGNRSCLSKIETLLHGMDRRVIAVDPGIVPESGTPDQRTLAKLVEFAPDIVFVGLGCPKQEKWAFEASQVVPSTFIGVGAAFDYLAGDIRRAPPWIQRLGLEWLYRLMQQPRLLRRYLTTNLPFLVLLANTMLRKSRPSNPGK